MTPLATLRLQFPSSFTFADAAKHVAWYATLGISHIYASPLTTARIGSTHGYDVVDPTRINPELGGEEGLRAFAALLREAGLGLILDIVPNHMAADPTNAWWRDVLLHGRTSRYASWFDIDWDAPGSDGKVLLPILGTSLEEMIAAGELKVERDSEGRPTLRYGAQLYPLAMDHADSQPDLRTLLARQHYRLMCWRGAGDCLNWRRFFDINELVCLRMEEPSAFEAVHALPLRLFAEGVIDGLRIDHVDGLTDPAGYCRTLRARLQSAAAAHNRPNAWLVIEKILLKDETLSEDWGVDGTTGYDFMNDVSALQHDGGQAAGLGEAWATLSGRPADFAIEEERARSEIVARSFSAQLEACAFAFEALLGHTVPRPTLRRLLTEILVHLPVYRTYAVHGALTVADSALLTQVGEAAHQSCLATDRWAVSPLITAMCMPPTGREDARRWDRAMARLQQLSAPIAAKAVEDTGFYRFGRLLSRNDVGFDTTVLGIEPADFHARVSARQATFPRAILATATHDHKRGEDLRARLATLSECAPEWTSLLARWLASCDALRAQVGDGLAPSAGDIAMLLQMVVGGWPLDLDPGDMVGRRAFAERLARWQEKALREAKLESDWADVNVPYEAAAQDFTRRLIAEAALPEMLREIVAFIHRIAPAGAINGLAQCLLKFTVPGVPDLYQGCDLWDFSFVDPDNRRPVDFGVRARSSRQDDNLAALTASWRDGRIKQHVIWRVLTLRRQVPELFAAGDYTPLCIEGDGARSAVAFVRRIERHWMLVIAPRLMLGNLSPDGGLGLSSNAWKGLAMELGAAPPSLPLYDWLGGGIVELQHRRITLDLLCGTLPLALVSTAAPDLPHDC